MSFYKTQITINGRTGIIYEPLSTARFPLDLAAYQSDESNPHSALWYENLYHIWLNESGQWEIMLDRSGYASENLDEIERLLRVFMLNEGIDGDDDIPLDMAPTFTYPIYMPDLNDAAPIAGNVDKEEIYNIIDRVLSDQTMHGFARDICDDYGVIHIHSAHEKAEAMRVAIECERALAAANYMPGSFDR